MLVTGLHERQRAVARTTGLVTRRPPPGSPAWLTWRKALLGGGLAFGALAVVAAGYTAMRLLGIGPVGTLVASGVLKDREPLVLADFENRTRGLDARARRSPRRSGWTCSQSPTVRVLDQQAVRRCARSGCSGPATGTLPAPLARELAEREGDQGGRHRADRSGGAGIRALGQPDLAPATGGR